MRIGCALVALQLAGCAPGGARLGAERSAIVGGFADPGDPGVVYLLDDQHGSCTAEIVSPHVAVTAAHCVLEGHAWTLSLGPNAEGPSYPVREAHANPGYVANGDASHDNAVLVLSSPVPVPPLVINRRPLTPDLVGRPVRIIGYGLTSARANDADHKRQASTPLLAIDTAQITVGDAVHAQCNGDSGGAALMTLGGVEVLVATDSQSANDLNGGCAGDLDARIDVDTRFIDPFIHDNDPGFLDLWGQDAGASPSDGGAAPSGWPDLSSPPDAGTGFPQPPGYPPSQGTTPADQVSSGCAVAGGRRGGAAPLCLLALVGRWRRARPTRPAMDGPRASG
jgi:hypothetical protein